MFKKFKVPRTVKVVPANTYDHERVIHKSVGPYVKSITLCSSNQECKCCFRRICPKLVSCTESCKKDSIFCERCNTVCPYDECYGRRNFPKLMGYQVEKTKPLPAEELSSKLRYLFTLFLEFIMVVFTFYIINIRHRVFSRVGPFLFSLVSQPAY